VWIIDQRLFVKCVLERAGAGGHDLNSMANDVQFAASAVRGLHTPSQSMWDDLERFLPNWSCPYITGRGC